MAHRKASCGWSLELFGYVLLGFHTFLLVLGSGAASFTDFSFVVEPNDTTVSRESSATLHCAARQGAGAGAETPQIQWRRDADYLNVNNDAHRELLSNGSLHFTHIIHSSTDRPDEGVYQCVATVNDLGSIVSRKAKLQIAYLSPDFQTEPGDLLVHIGDTAMMPCGIEGRPLPTISWYQDDRALAIDNTKYLLHQDGVLEINDVQINNLGVYKCLAQNIDSELTSRGATLSRNPDSSTYQGMAPQFVMCPKDSSAREGSTVLLYCAANGRDRQGELPTISWLKDGITVDMEEEDTRFSLAGQGSLQIRELQEGDSGSYTCRASNLEDSVDSEALLTVTVPPRFVSRPVNKEAQVNADVEFVCNVYGQPRPTIQWLKNGDVVHSSDYFQIVDGQNLRILGLVSSDAGVYQCFAENEVGNVQANAQLLITQKGDSTAPASDLPGAPEHLVARIVSTRFITLSWAMPTLVGNSRIVAYSVFWREVGSQRERMLNTTRLEANIQHLKPATQYEFRVQSYNEAGPSLLLTEITVETKEEVNVPEAPSNVVAIPLSSTSIHISWEPPASQTPPITGYSFYYYKMGGREQTEDVDDTEITVTDLDKYARYSFRVVALNRNGPGVSSEEVSTRTFSDVPSEPPQNVTLEAVSSTSIIVRWEAPPDNALNGIITGYKVRYKLSLRASGSSPRGSQIVSTDSNRRALTLTDLERGLEYMVRVQALSKNGSSPATSWLSAETFLADRDESRVPGKPTSLHLRPMANSIAVSWTPPSEEDVMVRGYVLGYGIGIPDTYQQDLPSKQRYHTIKNLTPSSQYVISLRAYNHKGAGQIVYETVYTREETTPEPATPMIPPVGLKAIVLSPNTIVITWSDTSLGRNQRITDNRFYTIRYSQQGARRHRFLNATDLNLHIDDLKPNTEYEFSVKVIKGRRDSTWSMSVLNKTFEDVPASTPRDLTPVAVEGQPTWITLNWQPPRQPNGQITGYYVFYTTDATQPERDWVVEGVRGDTLSTTIRDLTPETTYYLKVQARNSKGMGPMSPTVIFRTPSLDGVGGGRIETPRDYGQPVYGLHQPGYKGGQDSDNSKDNDSEGIPPMVLWIVIGCVSGISLLAIIAVIVVVCKRRSDEDRKKRLGYHPANKPKLGGPKMVDIKPPDLWIHDMEMKNMDKNQPETASVTPIPRDNGMMNSMEKLPPGEGPYSGSEEDQRLRRPSRAKPIMIPVDQPPPPREPIATAIPNGHILSNSSGMPRSLYSRPAMPYSTAGYQNSPRINISPDTMQPGAGVQSPDSPCSSQNSQPPIPYEQLQHTAGMSPEAASTLPLRPSNPLKSFAVPGPPGVFRVGPTASPSTPGSKKVKPTPQSTTSPYKKPPPPSGSTSTQPYKPRSPLPVVTPKAPDVTVHSGGETDSDLPKSYSAEELSAEMANLEGLMKDLNAITQQEFEC